MHVRRIRRIPQEKRRILLLFFALMMLAVTAVMQCNAQLLWKVSGNGLSKPSYLFGTFHVAPVSLADSIAGLDEAIKSVDAVYGELSLDDINAAKEQIAPLLIQPRKIQPAPIRRRVV